MDWKVADSKHNNDGDQHSGRFSSGQDLVLLSVLVTVQHGLASWTDRETEVRRQLARCQSSGGGSSGHNRRGVGVLLWHPVV